ncbi:MAG TPA: phosphoglucomutase (alpha-D-glucose-1,6-bisphosphate-dependent) [Opitutaceae bacterium]|jgi:phosphoglucomutase|nr:phosphoglucomutase (alpha-D-glucose-1,6-bisphosphate-dependent) [Opitutaceae bacterium]
MKIDPNAGKPAENAVLVDVPKLITAYFGEKPDPSVPAQRVSFGTSGHRGCSFNKSFNEDHILATTQAICLYRKNQGTDGPLFMGIDTHALSFPAYVTAIEVLAANGVELMLANADEYTPTPVISHAILTYNRERKSGLADGIVITPSHNPPTDGGFKYNPSNGGPADTAATGWIERKANEFLEAKLEGVKRMPLSKALTAPTTRRRDYITPYVSDLGNVVDLEAIKASGLKVGVDPLGGAGVHYWSRIRDLYGINLTVVSEVVDPTFRFMTRDWDGQIRMDPSSPYAMERLIAMKDRFDLSFACDTDHDRHGIVTRSAGLLPPNHYLSVAISYLYQNRPNWPRQASVGKTVVSSQMIDKVASKIGRGLLEVPVGFKWFVGGLLDSSICFGGEESAGASFSRKDGKVWSTDKDGFIPCLLAAEMTSRQGRDPGDSYRELTKELGEPVADRVEAPASRAEKALLERLSPDQVKETELAGEKITGRLTRAPGNGAPIGGLKVTTQNGWFAARPSGTEEIYKIYAESFLGKDHLKRLIDEAQKLVSGAISGGPKPT